MKHLFFAWTPLQLMNHLNLYLNYLKGEEGLIILYKSLSNVEQLKMNIEKMIPYLSVIVLDDSLQGISNSQKIFWMITNHNPYYKKTIKNMYISGDTFFTRLFYSAAKKRNLNLKLYYVEDGVGAYNQASIINNKKIVDKIKNNLSIYSIFYAKFEKYFVYHPDLLEAVGENKKQSLPMLIAPNPALPLILTIFNLQTSDHTNTFNQPALIYLDQPFSKDGTQINEFEIYDNLAQLADQLALSLYVKLHPRQNPELYRKRQAQFIQTDLPWELFILNHWRRSFLPVGVNSTAVFSPSLLFGKDLPALLLLEIVLREKKMTDPHTRQIINNSLHMVNKIKEKTDIELLLPESQADLENILKKISQENYDDSASF